MYSLAWLVVVGVVGLIVGGSLGHLVARVRSGGAARVAELEAQLDASQDELSGYKSEVYEQFSETARKFKALDETYHDLRSQLAQSAGALVGEAAGPLLVAPDEMPALDLAAATDTAAAAADEDMVEAVEPNATAEPDAAANTATQSNAQDSQDGQADVTDSTDEPPILVNEASLEDAAELNEGDLVADLDDVDRVDEVDKVDKVDAQIPLAERIARQQRAAESAHG